MRRKNVLPAWRDTQTPPRPELARLSDEEKERIAGVQASRDACKAVFDQFVRQPLLTGAATKRQIWEAVLAMYRRVYAAGNDWAPGDTLLWSEEFSVVTIEALRYAKFLDEQGGYIAAMPTYHEAASLVG